MEHPVPRKERERQERRRIMLDAARAVIAEKGFKRATLDEIAQRAEFGKGTIYNYFRDGKNEMLFAILDDVYEDVYQLTLDTFGSTELQTFRDQLNAYAEAFLSYFMRQQDLFVILMKEANRIAFGDDDSKAIYFKNHLDRLLSIMEPAIQRAIARGEVKSYSPESVAHIILGNVHGYLRHSCFRRIGNDNGDAIPEVDPREAAEFLSGMLLDGMASKPPARSGQLSMESTEEIL